MTKPSRRNSVKSIEVRSRSSLLSAIDIITLVFCGWILLYMSIGISRAPEAVKHIPIYLVVAISVIILAWLQKERGWQTTIADNNEKKLTKGAVLQFFRSVYPIFLFGYFFTSSHVFNRIIFPDWLDPWFMNIDKALFGYQPSLEWGLKYSHWALHELFHFAYFCYYPMIAGLPVYLYFKNQSAFKELIFNLTFVFYLCYTIYSVLPVIGGRFIPEAMELTRSYHAGPFTHIMVFIYRTSNHLGGAFPSSHIAITLVLTVAALRFVRPLGYVFCIIAFFLTLATVFCHYHWFIDAVAGVLTGIAGYYLANFVRRNLLNAGYD